MCGFIHWTYRELQFMDNLSGLKKLKIKRNQKNHNFFSWNKLFQYFWVELTSLYIGIFVTVFNSFLENLSLAATRNFFENVRALVAIEHPRVTISRKCSVNNSIHPILRQQFGKDASIFPPEVDEAKSSVSHECQEQRLPYTARRLFQPKSYYSKGSHCNLKIA